MGRELKRVPMDFAWPLSQPWSGYLNHLYDVSTQCTTCGGDGYSRYGRILRADWYGYRPPSTFAPWKTGSRPWEVTETPIMALATRNVERAPRYYSHPDAILREAKRLSDMLNTQWRHHISQLDVDALVAAGRLMDFTHYVEPGKGWQPKIPTPTVTAAQVNEWSLSMLGHDSINSWVCIKAACGRAGQPVTCDQCGGEGRLWPSPEAKAAAEAWESTEPPTGDGYQIWETVSEGNPISPVFATPRELAEHMATTRWGADRGTPVETWLRFIEGPGWAPSMVSGPEGLMSWVEAVSGHPSAPTA